MLNAFLNVATILNAFLNTFLNVVTFLAALLNAFLSAFLNVVVFLIVFLNARVFVFLLKDRRKNQCWRRLPVQELILNVANGVCVRLHAQLTLAQLFKEQHLQLGMGLDVRQHGVLNVFNVGGIFQVLFNGIEIRHGLR